MAARSAAAAAVTLSCGGKSKEINTYIYIDVYIHIICVIVSLYAGLHFAECEWELATTSCVLKIVFGRDVVFI